MSFSEWQLPVMLLYSNERLTVQRRSRNATLKAYGTSRYQWRPILLFIWDIITIFPQIKVCGQLKVGPLIKTVVTVHNGPHRSHSSIIFHIYIIYFNALLFPLTPICAWAQLWSITKDKLVFVTAFWFQHQVLLLVQPLRLLNQLCGGLWTSDRLLHPKVSCVTHTAYIRTMWSTGSLTECTQSDWHIIKAVIGLKDHVFGVVLGLEGLTGIQETVKTDRERKVAAVSIGPICHYTSAAKLRGALDWENGAAATWIAIILSQCLQGERQKARMRVEEGGQADYGRSC